MCRRRRGEDEGANDEGKTGADDVGSDVNDSYDCVGL